MVQVKTSDDFAQKAQRLYDEAVAIYSNDEASAEDIARAEQMQADADAAFQRSQTMRDLQAQKQKAISQFGEGTPNAPDKADDRNAQHPDGGAGADMLDGHKSLGHYFKAVWHAKQNNVITTPLRWYDGEGARGMTKQITTTKALAENTGATGGFLVPPEFQARLLAAMETENIIYSRAERIRMNRRTVSIPVLDQTSTSSSVPSFFGGMQAYWTEEAAEQDESQPDFRQITLTAHTLTAYTQTSDQLLDDSAISLEDFLMGSKGFPGILNWTTEYAFLRGDGVGKPEGILDADCTIVVPRDGAGQVQYEDLTEMMSNFMPSANGVWIASQNVMNQILTLQGPSGNPSYLWGTGTPVSGPPSTLLGYPIFFTDKLPALGTKGDIMLVDASYYLVGDRQMTTIDMSQEERFRFNQVSWKANMRIDGQPWLSAPITYVNTATVSPFVVLGDVAT